MMMNIRGLIFDDPHHTRGLTMTDIEFSDSNNRTEDGDIEITELSQ